MDALIDLTGKRFGKLTVLSRAEDYTAPNGRRKVKWLCDCDCGKKPTVLGVCLRGGDTTSCGCAKIELALRHGGTSTAEYGVWENMIRRCGNQKHCSFHRYGGRGITVCDRWKDFANFIQDMGLRPSPGLQLDRTDNDLGYSPDNCRWVTRRENQSNSSIAVKVVVDGKSVCLSEAARMLGLKGYGAIHHWKKKLGTHQAAVDHYVAKVRGSSM